MPQNVQVYGAFICSYCSQPLHKFTSSLGVQTLQCVNVSCPNVGVAYYPPTISINEYP